MSFVTRQCHKGLQSHKTTLVSPNSALYWRSCAAFVIFLSLCFLICRMGIMRMPISSGASRIKWDDAGKGVGVDLAGVKSSTCPTLGSPWVKHQHLTYICVASGFISVRCSVDQLGRWPTEKFSFILLFLQVSITLFGFWNLVSHRSEYQFKLKCALSSRMLLLFKSRSDKGNIHKKIQWLFQRISKKRVSEENQLVSFMVS